MDDEAAPTPGVCRCGLPFLQVGHLQACARCDQGAPSSPHDKNAAAPWFLRWQEQEQARLDGE